MATKCLRNTAQMVLTKWLKYTEHHEMLYFLFVFQNDRNSGPQLVSVAQQSSISKAAMYPCVCVCVNVI